MDTKLFERLGVIAGSVIGVGGVVAMFGFTVDPPWAKADDLKAVQAQVQTIQKAFDDIQKDNKEQKRLQLQIQRVLLAAQLKDAEADLRNNPNSTSAAKAVDDAKKAMADIDAALAKP